LKYRKIQKLSNDLTTNNSSFQGITVREGDSNLITRLESPKLGKMEMIREFSKDGMVLVSTKNLKIRFHKK